MRIGIPINILPGHHGGVETYARNLIRALQDKDSSNEFLLFCSVLNEEAFPIKRANFKKIVSGRSKTVESAKLKVLPYVAKVFELMDEIAALREFKRGVKRLILGPHGEPHPAETNISSGYDILHYMFTIYPFWEKYDVPVVLTMSDIQQEFHPEFFKKNELETRNRYFKPSAMGADHIIAVSEFTKKTIVEKYGVPSDKITVVHHGFDKDEFKPVDRAAVEAFRHKYKLPERFLLYPAATWPHKNHLRLVRAYKIFKDKYRLTCKLVLSGIKKGNHGPVAEEIKKLGLEGDIIHSGYLPYRDLPLLYNAASLLVFPSLFEGFGMPVIEAMAVGLPVACSNITCLPEVGGDAAMYFDPEDPEDIAAKVYKVCSDEDLRGLLVKKGLKRVQLFSWERTAKETLDVYEKVYKSFTRNKLKKGDTVCSEALMSW